MRLDSISWKWSHYMGLQMFPVLQFLGVRGLLAVKPQQVPCPKASKP